MRKLPPERILELIDFAQFLEHQNRKQQVTSPEAGESEKAIFADEEQWEQLLARPEARQLLREMGREAYTDYQSDWTFDKATRLNLRRAAIRTLKSSEKHRHQVTVAGFCPL